MKYGDLPSLAIVTKLCFYSFEREGLDLELYKFLTKYKVIVGFISIQAEKNAGNPAWKDSFFNVEIDDAELPVTSIAESDFESCKRPDNKEMWMSAFEIGVVLNYSSKIAESTGRQDT